MKMSDIEMRKRIDELKEKINEAAAADDCSDEVVEMITESLHLMNCLLDITLGKEEAVDMCEHGTEIGQYCPWCL